MEAAEYVAGVKRGESRASPAHRSCSTHDWPIRRYVQKVNMTPHSKIDLVQSRLFPMRTTVDDRGLRGETVVP